METPTPYTPNPLTPRAPRSIMPPSEPLPAWYVAFLEMRLRVLQTEINMVRATLNKPQTCPQCRGEMK